VTDLIRTSINNLKTKIIVDLLKTDAILSIYLYLWRSMTSRSHLNSDKVY